MTGSLSCRFERRRWWRCRGSSTRALRKAGLGPLCLGCIRAPPTAHRGRRSWRDPRRRRTMRPSGRPATAICARSATTSNGVTPDLHAPAGETGTSPFRRAWSGPRTRKRGAWACRRRSSNCSPARDVGRPRALTRRSPKWPPPRSSAAPHFGAGTGGCASLARRRRSRAPAFRPGAARAGLRRLAAGLPGLAERAGQAAEALGRPAPATLAEVAGLAVALVALAKAPADPRVLDALVPLSDAERERVRRLLAEAAEAIAAIEADAALFVSRRARGRDGGRARRAGPGGRRPSSRAGAAPIAAPWPSSSPGPPASRRARRPRA